MKTFIALLSVSLIILAAGQYGLASTSTATTNASAYSWTTGCAYVSYWSTTPVFAYCGGCATTYYQTSAPSSCTPISITGCAALSSANTSLCLGALPGYYLASSGTPTPCPSAVTGVLGSGTCSSASIATGCPAGWWQATTGANCTQCQYPSSTALSGCTQCDPSGSGLCISVGASASVPQGTSTIETTAANGFIQNCFITKVNGQSPCITPNPGYYVGGSGVTAVTAITNCVQYSAASTCTEAAPGYQVNSSNTSQVIPCTTVTASSTCSVAAAGYYVNGTAITAVPLGVATATSTANLTCLTSYYLTQTGLCMSGNLTDTHCLLANSTSVCVGCQAGYYFSANLTCGACGSNCASCSNATNCTACTNTTLYPLNSNGTCTNKTSSANILAPSFAILSMIFYYLF